MNEWIVNCTVKILLVLFVDLVEALVSINISAIKNSSLQSMCQTLASS